MGKRYVMDKSHNTINRIDLPRRLWAGLCLGVLLLSLALALLPLAARAQVDFDCANVTEIPQAECEALVAIYESTDGPNWGEWSNPWLNTNTPCRWHGIMCEAGHVISLSGSICVKIFCSPVGLNGEIPPEISNLTHLKFLGLSNNHITGLPAEIGQLSNLIDLSISNIGLSSLLPEIGDLASLQVLYINENQLTSLPPEFGKLSNLLVLYAYENQLTSLPPEIGDLASLQVLYINENQLTSLPPEIGNLANLLALWLDNNLLRSLPPEFENLSKLAVLFTSYNQLTSLPPEIGSLSNLDTLFASNNRLATLPPEIGRLYQLNRLDLSNNRLTTLPPEIGKLSKLNSLDLSNNRLTTLPGEIGDLKSLSSLELSNNQLSSLPVEFGRLPELINFNLSYNRLMLSDPCLFPFLKFIDPRWVNTQTTPPMDLHLKSASSGKLEFTWTPILYSSGPGYYELSLAEDPAGPYTVVGATQDKTSSQIILFRQPAHPTYYLRLRTFSAAHDEQLNDLWSEYSPPLAILTSAVSPENATSLAYTDEAGRLNQVDLPAETFAENGTLYFSVQSGAELPLSQTFAWQAISLGINHASVYADDLLLPNPFTLTVGYLDSCLPEANLNLLYWEAGTSQWVPAMDTCSPPGAFSQNLETNQIELAACRLGTYALAASQSILYFPMLATPYEGH